MPELNLLLLKDFQADQGVIKISSSREEVVLGLLPTGTKPIWMAMSCSRNQTSHTCKKLADEVAELIGRDYSPALRALQREHQHRADQR